MDESSGSLDEEIIEVQRILGREDLDNLLIRYAKLNDRAGNPEMWEELTRTLRRENQWPISRWFRENIFPILLPIILGPIIVTLIITFIIWSFKGDRFERKMWVIRDKLINYGYAEYVHESDGSKVWRIRKPKELK